MKWQKYKGEWVLANHSSGNIQYEQSLYFAYYNDSYNTFFTLREAKEWVESQIRNS